jgi:uncharacterized damage-inducible protein DinB
MSFEVESAAALLTRTPGILDSWLRGLGDEWIRADEGADTWSAFDVVGHLIQGERLDWIPRARMILEEGLWSEFDPFDRFAQLEADRGRTMNELLDEFAELRGRNLEELQALDLSPPNLDRRGRHPELGEVTLRQLLATWVAHDLGHLAQIARVMAGRYGTEVGPWSRYMSILQDRRGGVTGEKGE